MIPSVEGDPGGRCSPAVACVRPDTRVALPPAQTPTPSPSGGALLPYHLTFRRHEGFCEGGRSALRLDAKPGDEASPAVGFGGDEAGELRGAAGDHLETRPLQRRLG